jgi:hypothetical protein
VAWLYTGTLARAASRIGEDGMRANAYPAPLRLVAALLVTLSGSSLPLILVLVLLADDPPITPPVLLRLMVRLAVLPALGAVVLRRAVAVDVGVEGDVLVLERRGLRVEVPRAAIALVVPWSVPLPGPGLSLRLRSGRSLRYRLATPDPVPLLAALADVGRVESARAALAHPTVVWAHARAAVRRRWYHCVAKFGLFGLLPAAVLFNTHQHIAYGGALGQYYLEGLGPYLATFGTYWITLAIYLVLYASIWRGLGEGIALFAARVAPSRAARVRRAVEITCRVLYYGGAPLLLVARYLPW